MLEKYLIEHCAPTLASIKTANLFCFEPDQEAVLAKQLDNWNRRLKEKGVFLTVLGRCKGRALIYVCRGARLQNDLKKPGVADFLSAYGYSGEELDCVLERLRERLGETGSFPHEIGLFLGYPLEDVEGFIRNRGRNCKCAGCWKVYGDAGKAIRTFARFQKCREVYARLWREGRSVWQLTVAA